MSHDGETWRRLYTAMARLVSLAKATRFLGRCRHLTTAPRSLIAWPAILKPVAPGTKKNPATFLCDLRRAMLCFLEATLFVAISSVGGGESVTCRASFTSPHFNVKICRYLSSLDDQVFQSFDRSQEFTCRQTLASAQGRDNQPLVSSAMRLDKSLTVLLLKQTCACACCD